MSKVAMTIDPGDAREELTDLGLCRSRQALGAHDDPSGGPSCARFGERTLGDFVAQGDDGAARFALFGGQKGQRSLAEARSAFDGERAGVLGVVESRLDEGRTVARPDDQGPLELDLASIVGETALGEHGQLVAESNDVAVGHADASSSHASDESSPRTIEVFQIDAVCANFDPRVERSHFRPRDAYVCFFAAADDGRVAGGDHIDRPIFAREDEPPTSVDGRTFLIKARGFSEMPFGSRLLVCRTGLITLCHRSLFYCALHACRADFSLCPTSHQAILQPAGSSR